jgi:hypothetical protein
MIQIDHWIKRQRSEPRIEKWPGSLVRARGSEFLVSLVAGCSRSYYREGFTRSFGGGLPCNVYFIRFGTAMSIPACRSASFGLENLISSNRRQPFLHQLFSALQFSSSEYLLIQGARTIHSARIVSKRIQSQIWGYCSELLRTRR